MYRGGVAEGIDFNQSQVCLGIPADDLCRKFSLIRQPHLYLVSVLNHMVVGYDIPILIDNDARSQTTLFQVTFRGLIAEEFLEEIPEGIIFIRWPHKMAEYPSSALDGADGAYINDRRAYCLH